MTKKTVGSRVWLVSCGFIFAALIATVAARQQASAAAAQAAAAQVAIDADDIGGIVTGPNGPEAGVWVIAETNDLQTKLRKIVVTDDRGRYVVPDLPKANYKVWVRGYGLVDSPAVTSGIGKSLVLTAVPAPDAKTAAQVYPSDYWYSLLQVPPKDAFPMNMPTGRGAVAAGNFDPEANPAGRGGRGAAQGPAPILNQADWVATVKGCVICHQMGNKATREIPASLGVFDSSFKAWERRVQVGQNSLSGINGVDRLGHERALTMFADWTDRIAAGEIPPAPPRPQGLERNIVVTLWDMGNETAFMHDVVATDKNHPTVNANGPIYGAEWSHNTLEIVDPTRNTKMSLKVPMKDEKDRDVLRAGAQNQLAMRFPSPYWGEEVIWEELLSIHNPWLDSKGRVWFNARNRKPGNPDFCKTGSSNPFAKNFPIESSNGPQVDYFDPKTGKINFVDICFSTHHLQFANDPDETLYFSGGAQIGWIKTRVLDQTGSEEKAQGWCPAVIDYNGDGKIGAFTLPNEPPDKTLDRRIDGGGYGVAVNPVDGSVWYAVTGPVPGKIVRIQPGTNPPATCIAEEYEPPFNNPKAPGKMGATPRGIDVDRNGLVWTALATTGQMASFDRNKCAVKNGPTATGQHCPEGWTLYPTPSLKFKGVTDQLNADFLYYNWVDRYNTFGMGDNIPIATGTGSDSLLALDPTTGKWVVLRVPYPLGFYTRGLDGRIDDPTTGWKGRGLWAANETRTSWHNEGGKGSTSYAAHFQMRPDPLAK